MRNWIICMLIAMIMIYVFVNKVEKKVEGLVDSKISMITELFDNELFDN